MTKGYDAKGNVTTYIFMKFTQGAGGLTSAAGDMIKYIRFQLDETNKVINLSHQKTVETPRDIVGLIWRIDKINTGKRQISIVLLSNESDDTTQNRLVSIDREILEGAESSMK